jgi:copper chaperone
VTGVTVELVPGGASLITVTSSQPLPEQAVAAALDEAGGYVLAGA